MDKTSHLRYILLLCRTDILVQDASHLMKFASVIDFGASRQYVGNIQHVARASTLSQTDTGAYIDRCVLLCWVEEQNNVFSAAIN